MENSELAHELSLQILITRMTFRQTIQRVLKRNNIEITFEMLQILHRLWQEQGVSQQYLAEKTAKDKACLTNLINNLEKKGWVFRQEDPSDRRNKLIYLTSAGEALSNQIRPLLHDIYAQAGAKMNVRHIHACLQHLKNLNDIFNEI